MGTVCGVIEWADKARGYFPVDHVDISIETVSESARAFTIEAEDGGRERLFSALSEPERADVTVCL